MNIVTGTDTIPTMKNETKYHILKSTLSEYHYVITKEKQKKKKKSFKKKCIYINLTHPNLRYTFTNIDIYYIDINLAS